MAQHNDEKVQGLLVNTTFVGTSSTDLTTNIVRRLAQLTGDMAARLLSIIVTAGGKN